MKTNEPLVDNPVESGDNPLQSDQGQKEVNYEALYQEASRSVLELTAERDSLLSENTQLRTARDEAIADSAKIKEMNYTLSRQLNIKQEVKRQPEDIMADMFLKKGV